MRINMKTSTPVTFQGRGMYLHVKKHPDWGSQNELPFNKQTNIKILFMESSLCKGRIFTFQISKSNKIHTEKIVDSMRESAPSPRTGIIYPILLRVLHYSIYDYKL